jgi:hypothetical protein
MRLLLIIVGALAAILCIGKPAETRDYPWCAEGNYKGGATNCGFVTLQQCMDTVRGTGPVDQILCTSPRRDHMSWLDARGTTLSKRYTFRNSSGSLAILLAIRRASSRLTGKREGSSRLVRDGPETEQHQANDNER